MIPVIYRPENKGSGYSVPFQTVLDCAIQYAHRAANHDGNEWVVYADSNKKVYVRPVTAEVPEGGKEVYRIGDNDGQE